MISIDVQSLNDLAEVEKAIEKLSFVRDALKKKDEDDAEVLASQGVWYHAFNPAPYLADAVRRFDEKTVVTRFADLTPEDLDELNVGPVARSIEPYAPPLLDSQEAIQDDGIICLIDGEKRKFLSRYVRQVHGLGWEEYLRRFDLPADYPRTSKDVIEQRKELAIERGLGKTRAPEPDEEEQQVKVTVPVRRAFGRRSASPQVSVNIDINGTTVSATTDSESARDLERRLKRFL
jgi:predicted transcriptional regulator